MKGMKEVNTLMSSYKKGGITVYIPPGDFGIRLESKSPYKYRKRHPCYGCPYTLHTNVPSCMFPKRRNGSCFWYDQKKQKRPMEPECNKEFAAKKIFAFVEILEAVKRRKGFVMKSKDIQTGRKGGGDIYDCK